MSLRIGTKGGLLLTQQRTIELHKMCRISQLARDLLVSQEGLCFMKCGLLLLYHEQVRQSAHCPCFHGHKCTLQCQDHSSNYCCGHHASGREKQCREQFKDQGILWWDCSKGSGRTARRQANCDDGPAQHSESSLQKGEGAGGYYCCYECSSRVRLYELHKMIWWQICINRRPAVRYV